MKITWAEVCARRLARHGLLDEVERVGALLEGTPQLTISTVVVGAHAQRLCAVCWLAG